MIVEIDPTSFTEKQERGSPFHSSTYKVFSGPAKYQAVDTQRWGKKVSSRSSV